MANLPKTLDLIITVSHPAVLTDDDENAQSYYLTTLNINGTQHHLAIFPVEERCHGCDDTGDCDYTTQEPGAGHEAWYEGMQIIDSRDGGYQTVEIEGQPFVCVVTPFCR